MQPTQQVGILAQLLGTLLAVSLTTGLICAEVAVVLCYAMLCHENHRWWWRSFAHTASAAAYAFAYAAVYARHHLHLRGSAALWLYHAYAGLAAVGLGLVAGTIGLLASYWFVLTIFASLKFD